MAAPLTSNDARSDLISRIGQGLEAHGDPRDLSDLFDQLKALLPRGPYGEALREIFPGDRHASARVSKIRARAIRLRDRAHDKLPAAIGDGEAQLYRDLLELHRLPRPAQPKRLEILCKRYDLTPRVLAGKMAQGLREGAENLQRKARRDRGACRSLPAEVREHFLGLRLNKAMRHQSVAMSIQLTRQKFPDLGCSDHPFRQLARSIPKALRMKDREWRQRFLPSGQWEVPHPNHTWAFDMTLGDLFVWDGDPEVKPYRPHLTAIVDECSQSCMFGLYTEKPPSREVLQGVLLHAILEKVDKKGKRDPHWIQCGAPLYLHADNGKIQGSDWLQDVCRTMGTELDIGLMSELRHTAVRSPWQQGHIERFFGIVHSHFESQLAGYCGNTPENRPEAFPDLARGPNVWKGLLTLEQLNEVLHIWVPVEYHTIRHRRLKMSRFDYWQLHAKDHVHIPDETWLRQALMRRDTRKISRGKVNLNTFTYWHERLQGYEDVPLEVRWDPADLSRVLVLDMQGQPLCWAERERIGRIDHPEDLAALKDRRRLQKAERRVLREAAEIVAEDPAAKEALVEDLREAQKRAPIRFPGRPKKVAPADADESSDAEAMRELVGSRVGIARATTEAKPGLIRELYGISIEEGDDGSAGHKKKKPLIIDGMEV
jgi:transposase InsO family protein